MASTSEWKVKKDQFPCMTQDDNKTFLFLAETHRCRRRMSSVESLCDFQRGCLATWDDGLCTCSIIHASVEHLLRARHCSVWGRQWWQQETDVPVLMEVTFWWGRHIGKVCHTLGGEKSSEGTKQRWGSGSGRVRMENWSLDEVVPGGESGIRRKHWRE